MTPREHDPVAEDLLHHVRMSFDVRSTARERQTSCGILTGHRFVSERCTYCQAHREPARAT